MRTIVKRSPPSELVQWRQERIAANDAATHPFNYNSMRNTAQVREAVERGLHQEQGGICAYTGRRIKLDAGPPQRAGFHLEHLKGQKRCRDEAAAGLCDAGGDAHYGNLVACWPEPNQEEGTPYGAVLKHDWPKDAVEDPLFVSPLRADCTSRFRFDRQGGISAANASDTQAKTTIEKLGLEHPELTSLRREAIKGGLSPRNRPLTLAEAEKLARIMDRDESALNAGSNISLREFCFAVRPAVDKEISKLKGIRKSRKGGRN